VISVAGADPGVVAAVAERVLILEAGLICEEGSTTEVLNSPRHEYTQRLLEAAPSLSSTISTWKDSSVQAAPVTASSEPNPQS
jgi:ABC-type glutathione transport system ATPase component